MAEVDAASATATAAAIAAATATVAVAAVAAAVLCGLPTCAMRESQRWWWQLVRW